GRTCRSSSRDRARGGRIARHEWLTEGLWLVLFRQGIGSGVFCRSPARLGFDLRRSREAPSSASNSGWRKKEGACAHAHAPQFEENSHRAHSLRSTPVHGKRGSESTVPNVVVGTSAYAHGCDHIQKEPVMSKNTKQNKHDRAVDMTFPASDPVAHGEPTGTEKPPRPPDRHAPRITREQIEQAQRGEGQKRPPRRP